MALWCIKIHQCLVLISFFFLSTIPWMNGSSSRLSREILHISSYIWRRSNVYRFTTYYVWSFKLIFSDYFHFHSTVSSSVWEFYCNFGRKMWKLSATVEVRDGERDRSQQHRQGWTGLLCPWWHVSHTMDKALGRCSAAQLEAAGWIHSVNVAFPLGKRRWRLINIKHI